MMKKLLLIPLFALIFACGPASMPHEAESTVGITAPDGYAVVCATNYSRVSPHICGTTIQASNFGFINDNTCRTLSLTTIPSTSKYVQGTLEVDLKSNNAIALRQVTLNIWFDSGCTQLFDQFSWSNREEVAVAAGNTLLNIRSTFHVPVSGQSIYYTSQLISGGVTTTLSLRPSVYYD